MAWNILCLESKFILNQNNEYTNIYIGNAIKSGGDLFTPTQPADIENDPEGVEELEEPNPNDLPDVKEPDTDEIKDPEEEQN